MSKPNSNLKKPRSLKEIQNAYFEARQKAGDFQYQKYLLSKELRKLNRDMMMLNQEASVRQKMDAESKTEEIANEPEQKEAEVEVTNE